MVCFREAAVVELEKLDNFRSPASMHHASVRKLHRDTRRRRIGKKGLGSRPAL